MEVTRRKFFGLIAGTAALAPFAAKAIEGSDDHEFDRNDLIYNVDPVETPPLRSLENKH